jgi:hypothetical protein
MSTGPDDKKKRSKAIAGGKVGPPSPSKSRKKGVKNLTKPHIWVSRAGYGAMRAEDRSDRNYRIREALEKLLKDRRSANDKNTGDSEKQIRNDKERLPNGSQPPKDKDKD